MKDAMRKFLFCLFVISLSGGCIAKQQEKVETLEPKASTAYEIYPTNNMWNFIKLNTRNGRMWMVQYSIEQDKNRFETYLNETALVSTEKEMNGRFKLYPTKNIYTFILLDQIDGNTWQVQWSFNENQRMVIPIRRIESLYGNE